MKVQLRPITSIRPYDKNPRLNDQAVDAVANSIREFGFRQPDCGRQKRRHRRR